MFNNLHKSNNIDQTQPQSSSQPTHVPPNIPVIPNPNRYPTLTFHRNVDRPSIYDCADFKYQPYWKYGPAEWFEILEQRFTVREVIFNDHKFFNVVKKLSADVMVRLENLLKSLDPGNRYNAVKQALLDRYTDSDSVIISKFFSDVTLGNRTSSEFLEALVASGKDIFSKHCISRIWCEMLPHLLCTHAIKAQHT